LENRVSVFKIHLFVFYKMDKNGMRDIKKLTCPFYFKFACYYRLTKLQTTLNYIL